MGGGKTQVGGDQIVGVPEFDRRDVIEAKSLLMEAKIASFSGRGGELNSSPVCFGVWDDVGCRVSWGWDWEFVASDGHVMLKGMKGFPAWIQMRWSEVRNA